MILTQTFRARQPRSLLDSLNRESGRVYTLTMVEHWRIKRKKDIWISQYGAMRVNDSLAGNSILHAHSKDAAQEGFYKACKTSKALKLQSIDARYPHRRKNFRTTVWKKQGIRIKQDKLLLARARNLEPIVISIPDYLQGFSFDEVRLVFDHKSSRYYWHVVYDDKLEPAKSQSREVVAVDLGEIHPAAVCTTKEAQVISCRELRSSIQGNNKMVAKISARQSKYKKGSRRWKKLQRAKSKKLGKFKLKQRDICHKVSRAIVDFAEANKASKIVIGDVRDIQDGIDLSKKTNQKISQWPHGIIQRYVDYKAARKGIETKLRSEAYTSQTCPGCGNRQKPQGRIYRCSKCGWSGHRDGEVGAPNILSLELYGELGRVRVQTIKYRHPFLTGKRSRGDTTEIACGPENGFREASGF